MALYIEQTCMVYTVRLAWSIGQPFVCGTLKEVVEYSLLPNNGIEYFAEISNTKLRKLRKKEIKHSLECLGLNELSKKLFNKF